MIGASTLHGAIGWRKFCGALFRSIRSHCTGALTQAYPAFLTDLWRSTTRQVRRGAGTHACRVPTHGDALGSTPCDIREECRDSLGTAGTSACATSADGTVRNAA